MRCACMHHAANGDHARWAHWWWDQKTACMEKRAHDQHSPDVRIIARRTRAAMARWSSSASAPTLATTASGTPMTRAASASHRRPPLTLAAAATGLVAESLPPSPSSDTAASGASDETDVGAPAVAPVVVVAGRYVLGPAGTRQRHQRLRSS